MSIAKVFLLGNLSRDPEIRYSANGTAVCGFSVAVNRKANGKDEVDFFDVTCFDKTAESCSKYLSKGSRVAIDGSLRQERWQDDSGKNHSKVKVVAFVVEFLSKKKEDGGGEQGGAVDEGDIPF